MINFDKSNPIKFGFDGHLYTQLDPCIYDSKKHNHFKWYTCPVCHSTSIYSLPESNGSSRLVIRCVHNDCFIGYDCIEDCKCYYIQTPLPIKET